MGRRERMNDEPKRLWVEALRSGRFNQGKARLCSLKEDFIEGEKRYCCLGVLCEIAIENGVQLSIAREFDYYEGDDPYVSFDGSSAYLPEAVQLWAGLNYSDPVIDPVTRDLDGSGTASYFNDAKGYTFAQIADLIEKNL